MRYQITPKDADLLVEVFAEDAGDACRDGLLSAFQTCQRKRCSCAGSTSERLESLDVELDEGTFRLRFHPKAGDDLARDDIEQCLQRLLTARCGE